jgi:hypothetical protein
MYKMLTLRHAKYKRFMIQRLQTVYFIAIILICLLISTGTLLSGSLSTEGLVTYYQLNLIYFKVFENGTLVSSEIQYFLIFLLSAIIGWTLNIMFSFKDRSKQIKLAKWNYLFILLLIVALFTKAVMDIPGFAFAVQRMDSVFGLALLFFIGYLNFRAIMLIKKDDALVKSADRIR